MDRYDLGLFGILVIAVVLMFVIVPLAGELMHYLICNVFGHDINDGLYWAGIGLLSVYGIFVMNHNKDD